MRGLDSIDTVGVVGAGTMGNGIAQVAATAGYDVLMRDVEAALVEEGREAMRSSLDRLADRDGLDGQSPADVLDRVTGTTAFEDLASADVIVEAAVEDLDVKRDIFADLDDLVDEDVVLATNTSTLSITSIGAATDRAPLVVGLHFMNPAPIMEGVELIVGERTAEETVAFAHEFAADLGKTTWAADDRPGFVVNRILMPWLNEGIRALEEGVADKADIDRGMELGTNVPMGPLELADQIGLDICLDAMETLEAELGDQYRPAYLLRRKVEAGDLGRKTGRGFYEYD